MASFYLPWKTGSFLLQGWYTRLKGRIDRSLWIFGSFPVRVHRREFHFRWPVHVKWVRRKWIHGHGMFYSMDSMQNVVSVWTLAFHSSSPGRTAIHQFVSTSLPISLYIEGLTCSIAMTSTTVTRTFNSSSWFEGFNFCFHFLPAEFSLIQPISSWVWQNAHQTLAGGTRWTRAGWRFQRALSRDLHGPRPSALHGVRGTRGVPRREVSVADRNVIRLRARLPLSERWEAPGLNAWLLWLRWLSWPLWLRPEGWAGWVWGVWDFQSFNRWHNLSIRPMKAERSRSAMAAMASERKWPEKWETTWSKCRDVSWNFDWNTFLLWGYVHFYCMPGWLMMLEMDNRTPSYTPYK